MSVTKKPSLNLLINNIERESGEKGFVQVKTKKNAGLLEGKGPYPTLDKQCNLLKAPT